MMLPREPTEAMMAAGLYASGPVTDWVDVNAMWKAMFDAVTLDGGVTEAAPALGPNELSLRLEWATDALRVVRRIAKGDAKAIAQAGLDLTEADEDALIAAGNDEALASLAAARATAAPASGKPALWVKRMPDGRVIPESADCFEEDVRAKAEGGEVVPLYLAASPKAQGSDVKLRSVVEAEIKRLRTIAEDGMDWLNGSIAANNLEAALAALARPVAAEGSAEVSCKENGSSAATTDASCKAAEPVTSGKLREAVENVVVRMSYGGVLYRSDPETKALIAALAPSTTSAASDGEGNNA